MTESVKLIGPSGKFMPRYIVACAAEGRMARMARMQAVVRMFLWLIDMVFLRLD